MFLDNSSGAKTRQKVVMTQEYFECSGEGGDLFDHFVSLWKKGLVEFTFFQVHTHEPYTWEMEKTNPFCK